MIKLKARNITKALQHKGKILNFKQFIPRWDSIIIPLNGFEKGKIKVFTYKDFIFFKRYANETVLKHYKYILLQESYWV